MKNTILNNMRADERRRKGFEAEYLELVNIKEMPLKEGVFAIGVPGATASGYKTMYYFNADGVMINDSEAYL